VISIEDGFRSAGDASHSERPEKDGFLVVPNVVNDAEWYSLTGHIAALAREGAGSRTLLDQEWCVELAQQLRADSKIGDLLPASAVAVQCTLFDKSPDNNWLVALHQDLSIPVRWRVDSPECSGWSEKEGQLYAQPPVRVLEQLVAVRIHIDDCPAESGALRMVAKSHVEGRLSRERAEELQNGEPAVPVSRGGALVMRPLILHASSKATSLASRRVLHFVFGPQTLPLGLEWRWAA
jgi:ectoine hydroxylase-related dioxygenase (phytanoyl-CoA dioxygenase family)